MSEFISWKTQPLFISSTFIDMMAERDALRDFVFPELAERLRARHIHLEPIDLRWGVETANEKEKEEKELLVLKVCLDEIDKCKPFLIGLIGDRYGWVPPEERMKAAEREKGFKSEIENKSITALEIEYGVLSNEEQMHRSRFYFRKSLDYDKMTEHKRADFSDMHNPEFDKNFAEKRLTVYKESILEKVGEERVYHYNDLEDFKKTVTQQLWTELEAQTKDLEDLRPKTWQEEERVILDEFIEERSVGFAGREDIIDLLKKFANSPRSYDRCGLCLSGESGSGKSALFTKLCKELRNDKLFILAHAAGISLRSNSLENMLLIWIDELANHLKIDITEELKPKQQFVDISRLFAELLSRTAVNERVIVLVDSLNQFERTEHARYVNWLPELLPENVKFIFTAIHGEETTNLSKRKGIEVEELKPVTKADSIEIINTICNRYHKSLNKEITEVLLSKKTDAGIYAYSNPLWLNMAVDEFLLLDEDDFAVMKDLAGNPEEKLKQLLLSTAQVMPADIEGMYAYLFNKTCQRFGKDFVNAFLGYISVTRHGLRESDLEKLLTDVITQKWDPLKFAALRRYLRAHIVRKGEEGLWDFRHVQIRAGLFKLLLKAEERQKILHQSLASHLEKLPEDDSLRMTEIMWHFFKADDTEKAARIYGSYRSDTQQTIEHSKTLKDILLYDENSIKWITEIVEIEDIDENLKSTINNNFLFTLSDQLEDSVKLREQKYIFLSVLDSTRYLSVEYPDSVNYVRDLSVSYERIGKIYLALGDTKSALASYESTLKITEELRKKNPDLAKYSSDWCISCDDIGHIHLALGDTKSALTSFENSLKIREELRTQNPDSDEYARDLSLSFDSIGDIYKAHGDTKSAHWSYESAFKIREELRKKNPASVEYSRDLSLSYDRIGHIIYKVQGDTKGALRNYETALKIREELRKQYPDSALYARDVSVSYDGIGDIYEAQGDTKSAFKSFESALKITEELRKRNPDSAEYARNFSVSCVKIGDIYKTQGDTKNALRNYKSALKIDEELRKRNPNSVKDARGWCISCDRIGDIYKTLGDTKSALKNYESSLKIREELQKRNPDTVEFSSDWCISCDKIGDIHKTLGDTKSALKNYESSLMIRDGLIRKNPDSAEYARDMAVSYQNVGYIYKAQGDTKSALSSYESALNITEVLRQRNPDSAVFARDLSVVYNNVGNIYEALGDAKCALIWYVNALKIREELRKRDRDSAVYAMDLSLSYVNIGDIYKTLGDTKNAFTSYESALKIREELRKKNPDSVEYAWSLSISYNNVGDIYKVLGNTESALTSYESSLNIREELRKKSPDSIEYSRALVISCAKLNRIDDLILALKYMKNKSMYMDPPLVEICKEFGI